MSKLIPLLSTNLQFPIFFPWAYIGVSSMRVFSSSFEINILVDPYIKSKRVSSSISITSKQEITNRIIFFFF